MKLLLPTTTCLFVLHSARSVLSDGTELGGGIVTRTNVEWLADLNLDVRDMRDVSVNTDGSTAALQIYKNGRNSMSPDGTKFTLSQLSSDLASLGVESATPMYLFQLLGFADRDVYKLKENLSYADRFVQQALKRGDADQATTAALVLNIWMYATHVLYKGLEVCQKLVDADNQSQFNLGSAGFDDFIALWIGSASNAGAAGLDSLYAMSQYAYTDYFGGIFAESPDNTKIKELYQEASTYLSIPSVCTKDHPESPRALWSIANQMVSQMYVPLLRLLIASIVNQDKLGTHVYAMAIVPQAAQCRPSVYKRLKDYILTDSPRFDKSQIILRDLQDLYACFGLSCDDIGALSDNKGVTIPECIAADERATMAAYRPTSGVHTIATIDLDILQIRELTAAGSFYFAKLWYLYGRNSPVQRDNENDPFSYYSIADLAMSSTRRNADPWYSAFVRYHDNDANYADKMIQDTLDGTGKWGSDSSPAERSAVISETSAFMVVYLHMIGQLNDAVNHCDGSQSTGDYDLTDPWDEVAALIIGSLEGTGEGGSSDIEDGELIWSLGKRRAFQFQTLNKEGYARIDAEFEDLLYAGKGEIDAQSCDTLKKTAQQLQLMSMVPIMQSVLKFAVQNDKSLSGSTKADSVDLALGETYALAILPIMEIYDSSSASIIKENMIVQSGADPVRDGAQTVADAMGSFAVAAGIQCQWLGYTAQAEPCRKHGGNYAASAPGLHLLITPLVAVVLSLWVL